MSEHLHQKALFEWAWRMLPQHPDLAMMYAIPNGGQRTKATAGKLRAEGVKAGVPDIHLAVPRGPFHGLYIEMKYGDNKLTKDQERWLSALQVRGYCISVCYDWQEAAKAVLKYLELPCQHLT